MTWQDFSFNLKMQILSGASTVMVELLLEDAPLVQMIQSGASHDECLAFVNENY